MSSRSSRIGGGVRVLAALAALALTGCGGGGPELSGADFELPETAVLYEVRLEGMPTDEMVELAEESLTVFRYRDQGATSLALLRRRAEKDLETIRQILHSNGYYDGSAEAEVEDLPEEEFDEVRTADFDFPSLSDLAFWKRDRTPDVEDVATQYALVVITVEPGSQFTLVEHDFGLIDPEAGAALPSPQSLGSPVGGPALAARIVGAEAAAVELLQVNGYPYAERIDRDALADLEAATLEVETQLYSGPAAVFGPVEFVGLEDVEESYLRTYIPWKPGQPVSQDQVRLFTRDLLATDLFDTAVVELPDEPPEAEGPVALPVVVTADERPFRTVWAGAEYSTDDGPGVTAGFQHRNLWGENETVTVDGELAWDLQALRLGYREPQFRDTPGQDLVGALVLQHEEDDAFDETRATLTGGLERELNEDWTIGYGGLLEANRITEDGMTDEVFLGGIPTFVDYDGTDDLLNPTEGLRARIDVIPFAGTIDSELTKFLHVDTQASTYWDILDNDDYVLAARARLGSIVANDLSDVPKNRRLYSGGGGSVRGYARREIGPLDAQGDPIGGRSVAEASLEMRSKLYGHIGGVAFVDAGTVDTESVPGFDEVQYAAGVGVRYHSPVGPIRLDVAFPLNPRDTDDAFQLYFSIGQAF